MKDQKVSLRIFDTNAPADSVITNESQARLAADTLASHLKKIAPSYADLLGGKTFDPTNPTQVTYVTGMNLEGQMNLAALAFGLTTVLTFFGAVLLAIGIVLLIVGIDIFFYHVRPAKKLRQTEGRQPRHRPLLRHGPLLRRSAAHLEVRLLLTGEGPLQWALAGLVSRTLSIRLSGNRYDWFREG